MIEKSERICVYSKNDIDVPTINPNVSLISLARIESVALYFVIQRVGESQPVMDEYMESNQNIYK